MEAEGTVSAERLALLADNDLLMFASPLTSYDTDNVNVFTRLYKFQITSPWIFLRRPADGLSLVCAQFWNNSGERGVKSIEVS